MMKRESRLQKKLEIGRAVSFVSTRARSNGSSTPFNQIFIVPLYGFRKAMNFPSGEIRALAISGLPKNTSRSITGGKLFCAETGWSALKKATPDKSIKTKKLTCSRIKFLTSTSLKSLKKE